MSKKVNRRKFLTAAAAGAGALASASVAGPAIAKERYDWRMVMTWQKALPGLGTGAVRLAKRIMALSDGRINITVYGGGELVPPLGVFDAVAKGTAELGHCAPYYWLNKSRAAAFFCAVPGGLTVQEHNGWLYFGGGQQLWDELYAPFGLKAFAAGNTGTQMGCWSNRTLNTVADIQGLKIRMPGLAGEVINRLGGSSQVIPPQELYTAMQSGVIDALEWVGPWNDMSLGFHKIAKHYYGPGFHEGGATLELMVNKQAFDDLPADLQRIVKSACAIENELMSAEYMANNLRGFDVLQREHNVTIESYSEDIQKAVFKTSEEVVAEVADDGTIEKKIFESYTDYRKKVMDYGRVMEYGFMRGRLL